MSSSEDESDLDESMAVYSDDESMESKKRLLLPRAMRKKTRSMDETEDEHTGLSPRMHRMDIIAQGRAGMKDMGVFFLDDGVETFSADGDPRLTAVREIYNELDHRVERAALSAGMMLADPQVANVKKQLALRAAELEAGLAEKCGGPSSRSYRETITRIVFWIQAATDAELRDVMEGRLNTWCIEDRREPNFQRIEGTNPFQIMPFTAPHAPQATFSGM